MWSWLRGWKSRHEVRTIARRLDWLFTYHLKPDGTPYTYTEIESIIARQSRRRVDAATMERLRHGQIKEPDLIDLRVLVHAFGIVSPYLLFDDDNYTDQDLEKASQAAPRGDEPMRQLAERSDAAVRDRLESFVEQGLIDPPANLELLRMGLGVVDRRLLYEPDTVSDEELLVLARRGDEFSDMMRGILGAILKVEQESDKDPKSE